MTPQIVTPLIFDSYIAFIKNGVGTNQFRQAYATVDGQKKEILNDGEFSCAYFVSSVLHQFLLINYPHTTVDGTVLAMRDAGWQEITEPKFGCVLVWEPLEIDGEVHKHIGFYLNEKEAISNSAIEHTPVLHHLNFVGSLFGERKIISMWWNDRLK